MTAKTEPCRMAIASPHISWEKPMLGKRRPDLIALCASVLSATVLFAVPAAADIRYVFTSSEGSFIYDSPSFFDDGKLNPADFERYSGNFDEVYFELTYILLSNSACRSAGGGCYEADFVQDIFGKLGTFYTADGAELVISQVAADAPVPELSSWALLAVGFAGLALARSAAVFNLHRNPARSG